LGTSARRIGGKKLPFVPSSHRMPGRVYLLVEARTLIVRKFTDDFSVIGIDNLEGHGVPLLVGGYPYSGVT